MLVLLRYVLIVNSKFMDLLIVVYRITANDLNVD